MFWRKKDYESRDARFNRNKKIFSEFPWLWAIRNKWLMELTDVTVENITDKDGEFTKSFLDALFLFMSGEFEIWAYHGTSSEPAVLRLCNEGIQEKRAKIEALRKIFSSDFRMIMAFAVVRYPSSNLGNVVVYRRKKADKLIFVSDIIHAISSL